MKKTLLIFWILIAVTLNAQHITQKGVDIKVGYNTPLFNFNDYYGGGLGIAFSMLYPFADNLQFTLNTGYQNWSFDNTAFNLKNTNEYYTDFNFDAPIFIIPLTLGIKYYASSTKVKPYFSAEFGFFYYTQEISGTYTWIGNPSGTGNTYTLAPIKDSGFKTMLSTGAGATVPLNNNLDLDFQIKMNALFNAQSVKESDNAGAVEGTSSTIFSLSIIGGINYYFN